MKQYESYKPSGVEFIGDIPEHWEVIKLKFMVDKVMGGGTPLTSNSDYWTENKDDALLWVAIADITKSEYIEKTKKYITEKGLNNSSAQRVEAYSILYSIYASLGKVAYSPYELTTNQAILAIKPKEELFYKFLFYYLKTIEDKLPFLSSSTTQNNISLDIVKNFNITQPPYTEQEKIANFLDIKNQQIEEFIKEKKRQLSLLEEQKEAIINQAVTKGLDDSMKMTDSGIKWIGDIPNSWKIKKLKYSINIYSGTGLTSSDIVSEGSYKVYGGNGIIGYYSDYNIYEDTLIIGRVGAKCGNVHMSDEKIWVTDNALIIKTSENYQYMYYYLRYLDLNKLSTSTAQPLITGTDVKNYKVVFPPKKEQKEIVHYIEAELSKIDKVIKQIQKEIDLIKEYKISLISEVVTGQIRVV